MLQKPHPAGTRQGHHEERTPQPTQGPIMAGPRQPHRATRTTKNNPSHKTTTQATTTHPAAPRRDKTMASIFGTLLSSQGSGAHRIRPSGHPSGQLLNRTRPSRADSNRRFRTSQRRRTRRPRAHNRSPSPGLPAAHPDPEHPPRPHAKEHNEPPPPDVPAAHPDHRSTHRGRTRRSTTDLPGRMFPRHHRVVSRSRPAERASARV